MQLVGKLARLWRLVMPIMWMRIMWAQASILWCIRCCKAAREPRSWTPAFTLPPPLPLQQAAASRLRASERL